MFEKVGVPILGVVENMAVHVCENCGHVEHIFGAEGGTSAWPPSTAASISARCR